MTPPEADSMIAQADWLNFIAQVVDSLAWPIVTAAGVWIMRGELAKLLSKISSVSIGNATATFDQTLDRAAETLASVTHEPSGVESERSPRLSNLIELAGIHPRAAVMDAWLDVESAARELISKRQLGSGKSPQRPFYNIQRILEKTDLLNSEEISGFRELRMARNRVAHETSFHITPDQAERFVRISDKLVDSIKSANK